MNICKILKCDWKKVKKIPLVIDSPKSVPLRQESTGAVVAGYLVDHQHQIRQMRRGNKSLSKRTHRCNGFDHSQIGHIHGASIST